VGEHPRTLGSRRRVEEGERVRGHGETPLDLLSMKLARPQREAVWIAPERLHLVDRPGEVHRSRARTREDASGLVEIVPADSRERVAHGCCHADRRCAANGKLGDRRRDVRGGPALELDELVRQLPLVEHDDAIGLEADDLLRAKIASDGSIRALPAAWWYLHALPSGRRQPARS
jgi:hypothetical protein